MEKRVVHTAHKFAKDVALCIRRKKETSKLRVAIELLATYQRLPHELQDHPLKGNWQGYRDLHLESDWLLIYKIDEINLWLIRTGTHADIFGV